MCSRHSFCLTRTAKILDGLGLTDSHTTIMDMYGLTLAQQDACNLYEWQPPRCWPDASYADGLTGDKSQFETKQRQERAIERHLRSAYPTAESWSEPGVIRWPELPLPDSERVQRAYDLALRAKPLGYASDDVVLSYVRRHLRMLGCDVIAKRVATMDKGAPASMRWSSVHGGVQEGVRLRVWSSVHGSMWSGVQNGVRESVWPRVWPLARSSVPDSVWSSVRSSVYCSMVRDDEQNPWLPLSEMATLGVYLCGVSDDGTAHVWRGEQASS